jgi:hypothetical protein
MLDNSGDTQQWQDAARQAFPMLKTELLAVGRTLDLHVGIITSDLGAGPFTPPACPRIGGDQGLLQNSPVGATCYGASLPDPLFDSNDRFLRFLAEPGQEPQTNFTGTLEDAFYCYANLGTNGCGFEHQLGSVRAALEGCASDGGCVQAANNGFLRADAVLAVVLVTDEDDCSAPPDTGLFDPSQTALDSQLGPITSYRCFQFGVVCNGADPGREPGGRTGCEPGSFDPDPRHQLVPVEEFVSFFELLKPDPRMLYFSVIAAPPEPVVVRTDAVGFPFLDNPGGATPAIRLARFVSLLHPDRAATWPVDDWPLDYRPAMTDLAHVLSIKLWL